jgi:hypothetical protein
MMFQYSPQNRELCQEAPHVLLLKGGPVDAAMVDQRVFLLLRARQWFRCNQVLKGRAAPNERPCGH